jgi:hypothetical protein
MKVKLVNEVVDANNDLIGASKVPQNGSDVQTRAANTTDYNSSVGHQQYRSDFLGRMGFSSLFYESKANTNANSEENLVDDLSRKLFKIKYDILKYYYKNPNLLKSDYRKFDDNDNNELIDDKSKEYAKEIMNIIEPHITKALDEVTINESISEDKLIKSKNKEEFSKKNNDNEILDKKIQKISGLFNKKLDDNNMKKLIKLLEHNNE